MCVCVCVSHPFAPPPRPVPPPGKAGGDSPPSQRGPVEGGCHCMGTGGSPLWAEGGFPVPCPCPSPTPPPAGSGREMAGSCRRLLRLLVFGTSFLTGSCLAPGVAGSELWHRIYGTGYAVLPRRLYRGLWGPVATGTLLRVLAPVTHRGPVCGSAPGHVPLPAGGSTGPRTGDTGSHHPGSPIPFTAGLCPSHPIPSRHLHPAHPFAACSDLQHRHPGARPRLRGHPGTCGSAVTAHTGSSGA